MARAPLTAVLDACVLYPAPLRDLLMWVALEGGYQARWSAQIHAEWTRNLLIKRPDLQTKSLQRTVQLMQQALPEAEVSGHEALVSSLSLPDPDDRHVLAAALHGQAQVIVTFNLKDFPSTALAKHRLRAMQPDAFLLSVERRRPGTLLTAARRQRQSLKSPPMSVDDYLGVLSRQSLTKTVELLKRHLEQI